MGISSFFFLRVSGVCFGAKDKRQADFNKDLIRSLPKSSLHLALSKNKTTTSSLIKSLLLPVFSEIAQANFCKQKTSTRRAATNPTGRLGSKKRNTHTG